MLQSSSSASRFIVLASGSRGNAAVVDTPQGAVLLDFGIGPRILEQRLTQVGISWDKIQAVVLTHTHTDHWKPETLAKLFKLNITLYGHSDQYADMSRGEDVLKAMHNSGHLQQYHFGYSFEVFPGMVVKPIMVSHDAEPTAAFRFQGPGWSLGYAADLGCIPKGFIRELEQVDVLALEFNHDLNMLVNSGRPRHLIDRILKDRGHLSNIQARAFLEELCTVNERLGHVVQLHLSQECNLPQLARDAVSETLANRIQVITARQDQPTPWISLQPWGDG